MSAVFVTYEDNSDCWPIFKHNIDGFFPLKNVHKPKIIGTTELNTMIRTIPIINVKFIPLKADLLSLKSHLNIHETPYLHIFIGFCEDIDVYRHNFRPKLKSWFESVPNKKNSQFIIILLENHSYIDDSVKSGKTFLLDKIRFDFSDKLSFKLISLKIMPGENLNSLPECIDLISDCIYHSAIMNLSQMDEVIRKMSAQRNLPGWNFFTFFLTKESKALTLIDLGLFSEALTVYDELEIIFMEINGAVSSTEDVAMDHGFVRDDTINGADLIQSNWAKFRHKIHQNQISRYKFQVYLFSRQIHLLTDIHDLSQILKRCKYFICTAMFIHSIDESARKQWIFDVVFFIMKMIDGNSPHLEINNETANFLSDLLILANDQINTLDLKFSESLNDHDRIYDLSQIIDLSNHLSIENYAQFKISSMKYCIDILKKSSSIFKPTVIMIKLARLYYDAKMFNISLQVLQEATDQTISQNWPLIQISILELSCECYWNLNMIREYLRKQFELIFINGSGNILTDIQIEKIDKSTLQLDDILTLGLEKFFSIENLIVKESSIYALFSSTFVLPFQNCEISLLLSGVNSDINWSSSIINITRGRHIIMDLKLKNELLPGIYKLNKVEINFGKLRFETDNRSDLRNQDINIISENKLSLECSLPSHIDSENPLLVIRCINENAAEISDLVLHAENENLKLAPISNQDDNSCLDVQENRVLCKKSISSKKYIIVKYSIGNYNPGKNVIKIKASFKVDSKIVDCFGSLIEVDIPKSWNVETNFLNHNEFYLNSYRVVPEFETNSSIRLFDSCFESSIFEIESGTVLNISDNIKSDAKNILIKYSDENKELKSISIPVNRQIKQFVFCKCTPEIRDQKYGLGIPIQFDVQIYGIDEFESFKYSIYFDCKEWMLSGSSTGSAKEKWKFVMVPILSGLLQLPTISFSAPVHVFTNGSTILIS